MKIINKKKKERKEEEESEQLFSKNYKFPRMRNLQVRLFRYDN